MKSDCDRCGTSNSQESTYCCGCGNAIELPKGRILNQRFKIAEKIADGGMGRIYLGTDKQFPASSVAIKEMALPAENYQERQKREAKFGQEAQILYGLDCLGIPKVLAYFSEYNRYFLVMTFIHGKNLRQIFTESKQLFSEAEVTTIALKILDILNYLHSQKPKSIIHSDIKPENIMLTEDDQVKLVDFGVISLINFNGSTSKITRRTIFGTLEYIDPEILRKGAALPRNDLYSLGLTLLWMLTGCENPAEASNELIKHGISQGLTEIIVKALDEKPANKFQTALAMKKEILRLLVDKDSTADKTSATKIPHQITERPDISSLNITLQNLLLTLEDLFSGFSRESYDTQSLQIIINKIKEHSLFFCQDQVNFIERKIITNFLVYLIHWGEVAQHVASSELLIILHKEMKGFLDTETLGDCLRFILQRTARREYFTFLKKWEVSIPDNLEKIKQLLAEIVQNPQEPLENRCVALSLRHWTCRDLFQISQQISATDLCIPIILTMIQNQCLQEYESCMDSNRRSLKNMKVLESFLTFIRELEETRCDHFENLALSLLHDSIVSVDEYLMYIFDYCNLDRCRRYALEYLEIIVRLASKSKECRKLLCSNRIIIRWLEHVRGWSTFVLIISSLTIIWLIPSLNHYFSYKKQFTKKFAKLKKDLLQYLDNFVDDSEEGGKIISLIIRIKEINV